MKKAHPILIFEGTWYSGSEAILVEELPLTVLLNGQEYLSLVSSPGSEEELCLGILRTEGVIRCMEDVSSLTMDMEKREISVQTYPGETPRNDRTGRKYLTSGFAPGESSVSFDAPDGEDLLPEGDTISMAMVYQYMDQVSQKAEVFRETGGVHCGAVFLNGSMQAFYEDIGRHNVISKLIGKIIRDGMDTSGAVVVASGRISSEIVMKLSRAGIPILATRSAPTAAARELARKNGMTLIGFVRGTNACVYSGEKRILEVSDPEAQLQIIR